MTLDFDKLFSDISGSAPIEPRKIFSTLTRSERFKRPTDEQGEVLDGWFQNRESRDCTIKMNTGSGKTLVGLLLLQSSLNEGIGPAVYIAPDPYLVEQVTQEAKDLGIRVTTSERDPEFLAGKAILIINVHKLFNGRSTFGVGTEGAKIPIGSLVIDDAHACLASVTEQFTLRISNDHEIYEQLLELFEDDLKQQSFGRFLDLDAGDPQSLMQVPYWAWKDKSSEVLMIIHAHRGDDEVKWNWPLVSDVINLSECAIGPNNLEIVPRCLPVNAIPAFTRAKRRVYMTATLADDGILVSHFQAEPESISKPIKPKGAGDIGDRMILAPQEINPAITIDQVKALAFEISKSRNVVVIVPSKKRSLYWQDVAAQTLDKDSIRAGVQKMRAGHVGLSVLVNKYDGIDLPKSACELLVIDGLPQVYGLVDRIEIAKLEGTEASVLRQVQKLEQGMGRGVRSSDDHCVVLLLGASLTKLIHLPSARDKFTAATQAQLNLGRAVSSQATGKPLSELVPILSYCFDRDPKWVAASRSAVAQAPDTAASHIDPATPLIRRAFDLAREKKFEAACAELEKASNNASENAAKGYYKEQLAEYKHHVNAAESQAILASAVSLNNRVTHPLAGIGYQKLKPLQAAQAKASTDFLSKKFLEPNDLIIWQNSLLEDLRWDPDATDRFEASIQELGLALGFGSQRPELELGKGPDNLWATGGLNYFVIECKSGATVEFIPKKDTNQLNGSVSWFKTAYDSTCTSRPILIHPSHIFEKQSSPPPDCRIIDAAYLGKLKTKLIELTTALANGSAYKSEAKVAEILKHHNFMSSNFIDAYTSTYKIQQ